MTGFTHHVYRVVRDGEVVYEAKVPRGGPHSLAWECACAAWERTS